ncbi:MAG: 50S ribosomal protein L30 [Treponema sp.]|jgi:large subunit ribosomal protein L30|nr:50S ribosomal protein L30 [Treponema sp.]
MAQKVKITLVRSIIRRLPVQRATIRSLGLRKIGSTNVLEASPSVLGMVKKVSHLVSVEEVKDAGL